MRWLIHIKNLFFFLLQLFFDLLLLYILFTLIGCFWPRNKHEVKNSSGIPLLIHGDGFHTELYLPVEDSLHLINWMNWFNDDTIRKHQNKKFISIAWADADWMTEVAANERHRFSTVAEIVALPNNNSIMHVQWRDTVWPLKQPVTVKRYLSTSQYRQLINYIQWSFQTSDGKPIVHSYKGFYGYDYMYKSTLQYGLFTTCNQWTSNALHACSIRTATFSPFGWGLFHQLKK
ncbi:DUF2459 domain-containing protein [Lacibacter luteus]|uniref:DUF2459 domain-containing protein n=1 Tax=Lacibacter luteus TaxID=2508719 RepID=A0A4Q1CFU1_9BACT|nr:DUF2459 domain-containing protein [Lacibacter luteus]RXK58829.1 DUF2459 domain-containing protein [Lacibacter luteus]